MIGSKVKNKTQLLKIMRGLKARGKSIIFTNGCFDLLHYGHVKYLQDAKKKGDVLVVGVNSDASVKRLKGKGRPIINEQDRVRTVAALASVDYAILFKEDTPINLIKTVRPDVLVKGADWAKTDIVGSEFVSSYGGRVLIIKLIKHHSTTAIINKIVKEN
jgi:D-beta-D-heptose 7-phosphate kinase/D-beta-D-heptose 1-phosphate adenosyltransferase